MDLRTPSYKRTVRWTMQGLTEQYLWLLIVITEAESCVPFYWTRRNFSKSE